MIIGLSGYSGAGKDAVGRLLVERHGYERFAFADEVKEMAITANPVIGFLDWDLQMALKGMNWDQAKERYPTVRPFLQRLGEAARGTFGDHCWIYALEARLHNRRVQSRNVVITDVRYRNEACWIKHHLDGYVVRVTRPDIGPANEHISEIDLDDWDPDSRIDNYLDLEALAEEVDRVQLLLSARHCLSQSE